MSMLEDPQSPPDTTEPITAPQPRRPVIDPALLDEDAALREGIAKIKANKLIVLACAVVLGAAGWLYTYKKAPTWQAHSNLLLVTPDLKSSSSALASLGMNQPSPLAMLESVVNSRSSLDYIGKQTGIDREDLERWLETNTDQPSNRLSISAIHKDKATAIKMVQSAIDGITLLNRQIGFSTAAKQVSYLESTIAQRDKELRQKQDELLAYQRKMLVPIDPTKPETAGLPRQQLEEAKFELGSVQKSIQIARENSTATAKASATVPTDIPSINAWRQRLSQAEYKLRLLRIQLGEEATEVVRQKREVEITRGQLQDEIQNYLSTVKTNIDPRLAELEARRIVLDDQVKRLEPLAAAAPQEAVTINRLYREVLGAGEVLQALREQYERARTESEVDRVRWSVLDRPYLDDKPSNKNYARNVSLGVVLGLMVGSFWAIRRGIRH